MTIQNVCAAYFSPTGTTKTAVTEIAARLANQLNCPITTFDFTYPGVRRAEKQFSDRTLVVFGVPTYAGRVPNVLLKYLGGIRGCGAYAVPVVLYGNRNYDDSLIELRDILETDGFHTIAAAAMVGEHSFSNELAAGRPDAEDLKQARAFADRVAQTVRQDGCQTPVAVHGETPIRPYYTPRDRAGNPINILKVKPKTSTACVRCGTCAKVCPMGSINPDNLAEVTGICIKCGACVKRCPVHAKYYDDAGYLYHKEELELGYVRRAQPEFFL